MLHETPLEDMSFITVAVIPTVWPWSIACAEEGDRLTEMGGDELEHPAVTIDIATTNSATQQGHTWDMAPPRVFP